MRKVQLQTRIPFAVVIDIADDREKTRTVRTGIQDRVELPIEPSPPGHVGTAQLAVPLDLVFPLDRKSTRLNSSHEWISYAVVLFKNKNKKPFRRKIQK